MLKINNLRKNFGEKTAVDIDNFTVNNGDILGLVGNNGAGKTTLFRLILDLLKDSLYSHATANALQRYNATTLQRRVRQRPAAKRERKRAGCPSPQHSHCRHSDTASFLRLEVYGQKGETPPSATYPDAHPRN